MNEISSRIEQLKFGTTANFQRNVTVTMFSLIVHIIAVYLASAVFVLGCYLLLGGRLPKRRR